MKSYELVCGAAFEDLPNEEMMMYDGGGISASFGAMVAATTLPCLGGAAVSAIIVSVSVLVIK